MWQHNVYYVCVTFSVVRCLKIPTNNLPPPVSSHFSCVSTGHQDSYRE